MLDILARLRFPTVLLLLGVTLVVLGRYDVSLDPFGLTRVTHADNLLVGVGLLLSVSAIVGVGVAPFQDQITTALHIAPVWGSGNNLELDFGRGTRLQVLFGQIENLVEANPHTMVVLPANEFFDDECIRDPRSALGSFVTKHFRGKVDRLEQLLANELQGKSTELVERAPGVQKASYGLGTAVLLDQPLEYAGPILLVSVTTHRAGEGLRASPSALLEAMEGTYRAVGDHRIDRVFLPLLGAGHGGMRPERSFLTSAMGWADFLTSTPNRLTVSMVTFQPNDGAPEISERKIRRLLSVIGGIYGAT